HHTDEANASLDEPSGLYQVLAEGVTAVAVATLARLPLQVEGLPGLRRRDKFPGALLEAAEVLSNLTPAHSRLQPIHGPQPRGTPTEPSCRHAFGRIKRRYPVHRLRRVALIRAGPQRAVRPAQKAPGAVPRLIIAVDEDVRGHGARRRAEPGQHRAEIGRV